MKKKNKTILLVDANNRAWASFYSYSRLRHKGNLVSIIFGLPQMIRHLINRFKPDEIILVWDGAKSRVRLKTLPDYKGGRKSKSLIDYENWLWQKDIVQLLLFYLGVKQVVPKEGEADDYICRLNLKAKTKGWETIIVSSDKDFNQLIDDNTNVFNEKQKLMITEDNCKEVFGYHPYQTVDYLSIDGDTSDNIPGYPGIGKVKAKSLLEEYGSLVSFIESDDSRHQIDKKRLTRLLKNNRIMIDLLYYQDKYAMFEKMTWFDDEPRPKIKTKPFNSLVSRYNMKKMRGKDWMKPFKR